MPNMIYDYETDNQDNDFNAMFIDPMGVLNRIMGEYRVR